jgi:uncharacterized protein with GYD domain
LTPAFEAASHGLLNYRGGDRNGQVPHQGVVFGEGLKGLMRVGGTHRVRTMERALSGVGGSLESFYFAFGSDDLYVIVDMPDHAEAIAMAAAISTRSTTGRRDRKELPAMSPTDALTPPPMAST